MKTSQNILKNIVKKLLESDGKNIPGTLSSSKSGSRNIRIVLDKIIENLRKSAEQPESVLIAIENTDKEFINNFFKTGEGAIFYSDDQNQAIRKMTGRDPSSIIGGILRLKTQADFRELNKSYIEAEKDYNERAKAAFKNQDEEQIKELEKEYDRLKKEEQELKNKKSLFSYKAQKKEIDALIPDLILLQEFLANLQEIRRFIKTIIKEEISKKKEKKSLKVH